MKRDDLQESLMRRVDSSAARRSEADSGMPRPANTRPVVETTAIDEVFADEQLPFAPPEPAARRRDVQRTANQFDAAPSAPAVALARPGRTRPSRQEFDSGALLRSLAEKLDRLNEQQRDIRRLLDQAYLRVDAPR